MSGIQDKVILITGASSVRLRLIGATMSTVNNPSPIRLELELLGQTVVADSMQRTASRARS